MEKRETSFTKFVKDENYFISDLHLTLTLFKIDKTIFVNKFIFFILIELNIKFNCIMDGFSFPKVVYVLKF